MNRWGCCRSCSSDRPSFDGGSHESLSSRVRCRDAGAAGCCRVPRTAWHLLNWSCTPACSRNKLPPPGSLGSNSRRFACRGGGGVEVRSSGDNIEEATAGRGKDRQQQTEPPMTVGISIPISYNTRRTDILVCLVCLVCLCVVCM